MSAKKNPTVFSEPAVYVVDLGLMATAMKNFALCDLLAVRTLIDAQIVRKTRAERKHLEQAREARSQREDAFYAQLEAKQGAKPKATRKGRSKRLKIAA